MQTAKNNCPTIVPRAEKTPALTPYINNLLTLKRCAEERGKDKKKLFKNPRKSLLNPLLSAVGISKKVKSVGNCFSKTNVSFKSEDCILGTKFGKYEILLIH